MYRCLMVIKHCVEESSISSSFLTGIKTSAKISSISIHHHDVLIKEMGGGGAAVLKQNETLHLYMQVPKGTLASWCSSRLCSFEFFSISERISFGMLVHLGFGRDQDHLVDEPNPETRKSQSIIKLKLIAYIWNVYLLLFT